MVNSISWQILPILMGLIVTCKAIENPHSVYASPDQAVVNLEQGYVSMFDFDGSLVKEAIPQFWGAKFLYSTAFGRRFLLPIFKSPYVANFYGWYKSLRFSAWGIKSFAKKHGLNLAEFLPANGKSYLNFNDFFTRRLSGLGSKLRQPDMAKNVVVSPSDAKLFTLETLSLRDNFWLKESDFDLASFVGSQKLAEEFQHGTLMIFRLAPHDYHRFHAPVDMRVQHVSQLGYELESVSPLVYAARVNPLAKNKRVIIEAHNDQFGDFLIVPVGAMIVGKIQLNNQKDFIKGGELGLFEFGGSTVVLLFKQGVFNPGPSFLEHSRQGLETKVLVGQTLGTLAN
jgi:phosphatidylserine decarboxylase